MHHWLNIVHLQSLINQVGEHELNYSVQGPGALFLYFYLKPEKEENWCFSALETFRYVGLTPRIP